MALELPVVQVEPNDRDKESKGEVEPEGHRPFAHHRAGGHAELQPMGRKDTMKKFFAVVMSVAMVAAFSPLAEAQTSCPAEVAQAKEMLSKKGTTARTQDVQAPRSLAGARQDVQAPRSQDVQAPRGQNVQAPRSQDVQAPRSQDTQAPRSQDTQAPRSQNLQAPRSQDTQAPRSQDVQAPRSLAGSKAGGGITKAAQLVKDAEAACKAGDAKTAKDKATEALAILK
jgi:hypothetical protein